MLAQMKVYSVVLFSPAMEIFGSLAGKQKFHSIGVKNWLTFVNRHTCSFFSQVDPFHTLFGIAGLSLLGEEQIKAVNPVFCMPEDVLRRINVQPELVS